MIFNFVLFSLEEQESKMFKELRLKNRLSEEKVKEIGAEARQLMKQKIMKEARQHARDYQHICTLLKKHAGK